MGNTGSITVAVNDFINSLYAYKNISLYNANHVFDEEKSVRWNREEVERLNSSYNDRLGEAYTQARSEAAALSACIVIGSNGEKTLSQTARNIIQDDLLDELLKITDDLSGDENSIYELEQRTHIIVNKYLQFVKLTLAIEDKNKQEQIVSGEKWLDIRTPFSFHHKDVLYSNKSNGKRVLGAYFIADRFSNGFVQDVNRLVEPINRNRTDHFEIRVCDTNTPLVLAVPAVSAQAAPVNINVGITIKKTR